MFFCLKNCKQNSVCFCAFCVKIFLTQRRKVSQSLRGVVSHTRETQNLTPQVADFFQLIIQFFSCRENRFSCRENKFSCQEKKIPCLGNKISMPWKKNYQGWK